MNSLKSIEKEPSKQQNRWRLAVRLILAGAVIGAVLNKACNHSDPSVPPANVQASNQRRARVRLRPVLASHYFGSVPTSSPIIVPTPLTNNVFGNSDEDHPFTSDELGEPLTLEQQIERRNRTLCEIGSLVATDVQGQLTRSRRPYSFATVNAITRDILTMDYAIPGVPDEENPARAARVRTCLEDDLDSLAHEQLRRGFRAQGRTILGAGGSIASVVIFCDRSLLMLNADSTEDRESCLHQMLDERISNLAGNELQMFFERLLENEPDLAFTFFPGARREVQTAIRAALDALITRKAQTIDRLLRLQRDEPARGDYYAWQLRIMRPLTDYQSVLDQLNAVE